MITDVVNNFDLIERLMEPNSEVTAGDKIFQVFIIRRPKDDGNEDVSQHTRVIKCFFVKNYQELLDVKDNIISMCNALNARAYLNPGAKSMRNVTYEMINRLNTQMYDNVYANPNRLVNSVVAKSNPVRGHRWYQFDLDSMKYETELRELLQEVLREHDIPYEKVVELPTRSGLHFFTPRFNSSAFSIVARRWGFRPMTEDGNVHFYNTRIEGAYEDVFEIKDNSNALLYACTNTDYLNTED